MFLDIVLLELRLFERLFLFLDSSDKCLFIYNKLSSINYILFPSAFRKIIYILPFQVNVLVFK